MYTFGTTSNRRLETCRPEVRIVMRQAIITSDIDFGIVCGFRGEIEQGMAFVGGFSDAKWGESDHNIMKGNRLCSPAVDVAPYSAELRDYIWDDKELWDYLHDHITATAKRLHYKMMCGITLKNGVADLPHCTLVY